MSAMANTTPIVTTLTKPATNSGREKTTRDADATPRVNIQDLCEEYYEDILPINMDKIRRDKRKEVYARLDFGEGPSERRIREGSHYSSVRTLSARPDRRSSRDRSRGRSRSLSRDSSNGDRPQSSDCSRDVEESYDNSHSSYGIGINHGYRYHDRDSSRYAKRGRDSESLLSRQKDGETIEDFMERFKVETGRMKGAPECMRISGFIHGVNNLELIKRLNENVSKIMEEMMITTTAFIRGEAAAAGKKKEGLAGLPPYKDTKKNSRSRGIKVPAATTYGKLSHLIKEIKQGRDQSKVGKKEAPAKDKSMAIYMLQSWQRMIRQKVTQSFKRVREITFPSLATSSGTEGSLVIEAKIRVITSSKEIPKEARVRHENFKVVLHPNFPDQEVATGGTLSAKGRTELCSLLKENLYIFAW
nr:reverse transcriptase domain-containing protein [Tanacetum cinerariifolium]